MTDNEPASLASAQPETGVIGKLQELVVNVRMEVERLSDLLDRTLVKAEELRDEVAQLQEALPQNGHKAACYYCGGLCDALAGNPGLWPIPLCHEDDPGVVKWHHEKCVSARLRSPTDVIQNFGDAFDELYGVIDVRRGTETWDEWVDKVRARVRPEPQNTHSKE